MRAPRLDVGVFFGLKAELKIHRIAQDLTSNSRYDWDINCLEAKKMKKILISLATVAVLVVAVLFGAKLATAQSSSQVAAVVDSLNPLVPEKTIYVKTTKPDSQDSYGTPVYKQTAVDAKGNTRPIEFTGMKQFKLDHYLALKAKGAYVTSYHEVQANDISQAALLKLK